MTGCCVPECKNSSEKGFSLRRFPSNPERKALWITKINQQNWEPTSNSRICEVHFSEDMWEKHRIDGKRKLKCNAIPTMFPSVQLIKENKESAHTNNHLEDRIATVLDTSIQVSTIQSYNVEGIQPTSTSENAMQVHLNATIATPTSEDTTSENNPVTLESALLQIQALRKKYNEANKKVQIADTVVRKANKTKQKLLQQIRQLKNKNRLRTKKSHLIMKRFILFRLKVECQKGCTKNYGTTFDFKIKY